MRFNFIALLVLSGFFSLTSVQSSTAQDSTALQANKDSTSGPSSSPKVAPRKAVYVSGLVATSTNSAFYDDCFKKGWGLQLGVPLFSQKYYTLRFNLGYTKYAFQKEAYQAKYPLPEGASGKTSDLETVTLMTDVLFHPLPAWIVSPFVQGGIGLTVGSKDPSFTTLVDGKEIQQIIPFGSRYLAQLGIGASVKMLNNVEAFVGISYVRELLENQQPDDVFYKFKKKDLSYKYLYYNVGVLIKL